MFIVNFGRVVTRYSGFVILPLELLGFVAILLQPNLSSHQKYVLAVGYGIPLLTVGLVCLTRPYRVQQHFLSYYAKYPVAAQVSPFFAKFVGSSNYILALRACAVVALTMVAFVTNALVK